MIGQKNAMEFLKVSEKVFYRKNVVTSCLFNLDPAMLLASVAGSAAVYLPRDPANQKFEGPSC